MYKATKLRKTILADQKIDDHSKLGMLILAEEICKYDGIERFGSLQHMNKWVKTLGEQYEHEFLMIALGEMLDAGYIDIAGLNLALISSEKLDEVAS